MVAPSPAFTSPVHILRGHVWGIVVPESLTQVLVTEFSLNQQGGAHGSRSYLSPRPLPPNPVSLSQAAPSWPWFCPGRIVPCSQETGIHPGKSLNLVSLFLAGKSQRVQGQGASGLSLVFSLTPLMDGSGSPQLPPCPRTFPIMPFHAYLPRHICTPSTCPQTCRQAQTHTHTYPCHFEIGS